MRTIGPNVKNKLTVSDPIGGGEVVFFYRTPTTEERQKYNSALFTARGQKVKVNIAEARQKYGMTILTGIREGDFLHEESGKEPVSISSDPKSAHYRADWKNLVGNYASDLIEAMACHIFEGARIQPASLDEEDDDDGQEDNRDDNPDEVTITEKN